MLREWIAKESDILIQRNGNGQRKGITGRVASLPQIEDYLHEHFLKLRVQGGEVKRQYSRPSQLSSSIASHHPRHESFRSNSDSDSDESTTSS